MCKIFIIRHGKVDFKWQGLCDSAEFDRDCRDYDRAPLADERYDLPEVSDNAIYISTLPRSRDTAHMLFGQREFIVSELIDEVPLRSGFDTRLKLSQWFWKAIGRIQWYMDHSRQPESRTLSRERAKRFVELLCDDRDCTVVTHGFFMHTLLSELKHSGFSISKTHARYRNGECVIAERICQFTSRMI